MGHILLSKLINYIQDEMVCMWIFYLGTTSAQEYYNTKIYQFFSYLDRMYVLVTEDFTQLLGVLVSTVIFYSTYA